MITLTPNFRISNLRMSENVSPPYLVILYAALNGTESRPLTLVTFIIRPVNGRHKILIINQ